MSSQTDAPKQVLRLYQKRVSNLLRSLPMGIIVVRSDGTIETANVAIIDLFQYNEKELLGRNVGCLLQKCPWTLDDGGASFQAWYTKQDGALVELEGLSKDEEIIPIDFGVRELDPDAHDRMVVVVQDVTERFLANKLKSDFYQMINHDVRSPLSNLLLFFAMLRHRDECAALTAFGHERLTSAEGNVEQIVRLIDGLLEIDKLESGVGNLNREPVNVKQLIESSIVSVDAKAKYKNVELHMVADVNIWVIGDLHRLQQVLINLISNALEYTVAGKPMTISCELKEGTVSISVKDNGPGVPDSEKTLVFDRFKQGKKSASGGFGIGLAICKEIVRQHNGVIACKDGPDGGSVFYFTLPAEQF